MVAQITNKDTFILEDIITSSIMLFKDWESDMVIVIWQLRNSSLQTFKIYIIVKYNAGS